MNYPLTQRFVSGTLGESLEAMVKTFVVDYPGLSVIRACELAAAYMWIDYKAEIDRMSDDMDNDETASLAAMSNNHPESFQSAIIDVSGSRSLLLDEYEIEKGLCPFPLLKSERDLSYI